MGISRAQQKDDHLKPVIGLTGGVGAGKSTVAEMFALLGAAIIDSDKLIHQQYADPQVVETLRQWWGDKVVSADQRIDRAAIAAIVFNDANALSRLQAMLYPKIEEKRRSLMADYRKDSMIAAIVLDSPKLFEAGLNKECDCIIFVETDESIRRMRTSQTRGWDSQELSKREKLLDPLDKKKTLADYVLVNHAGKADVAREVKRIFSKVLTSYSNSAD